jgi:hypothetical protein
VSFVKRVEGGGGGVPLLKMNQPLALRAHSGQCVCVCVCWGAWIIRTASLMFFFFASWPTCERASVDKSMGAGCVSSLFRLSTVHSPTGEEAHQGW